MTMFDQFVGFANTPLGALTITLYTFVAFGCAAGFCINAREEPDPSAKFFGLFLMGMFWPMFLAVKFGVWIGRRPKP
jgi:hypothetical protein